MSTEPPEDSVPLRIFIGDGARSRGDPLSEALVLKAREAGLAGAPAPLRVAPAPAFADANAAGSGYRACPRRSSPPARLPSGSKDRPPC